MCDLSSCRPHYHKQTNKAIWNVTSFLSFVQWIDCSSDQCIAQKKCPPGKFTRTAGSTSADPKCEALCESWCALRSKPWATKCNWPLCAACPPCSSRTTTTATTTTTTATTTTTTTTSTITTTTMTTTTTTTAPCYSWCAWRGKVWTMRCTRPICARCSFCATRSTELCKSWCASNAQTWTLKCTWADCARCSSCSGV